MPDLHEITLKTTGFYNEHGGKHVCYLTCGTVLNEAKRKDDFYVVWVTENGWGEKIGRKVEIPFEHVSSVQRAKETA
jgi:hypothetical protein